MEHALLRIASIAVRGVQSRRFKTPGSDQSKESVEEYYIDRVDNYLHCRTMAKLPDLCAICSNAIYEIERADSDGT